MIQIRLGIERAVGPGDPLGRSTIGYRPGMSMEEAWEAGRGVWKLKATRVLEEEEAVVLSPEGEVLVVATITGISKHGDRQAIEGMPMSEHVLLGERIATSNSRNPVHYVDWP